jgi:hypothetical protein
MDEPKVGSVREWDNKNWSKRSRFVLTRPVHQRAPLFRKEAVEGVSREQGQPN